MNAPILFAAGGLTDVNPGLIIWTLATFAILLFVLSRVAWKPILRTVGDREARIHDALASAARQREEAERMIEEHRAALADARKESAEMVRKAQADLEVARAEQLAKAREEAEALIAQARRQISEEQKQAFAEVKRSAVDIALQAAARLLETEMDEARQRQLVESYISELESGARLPS